MSGESDGGDPLLGKLLNGRYRVERPLAQGGFGAVYLARDERTGAVRAVKTLASAGDRDSAIFLREARYLKTLTTLDHPGIVGHLDTFLDDGRLFLVNEYVEGEPLAAWREGRSIEALLEVHAQVAEALGWLHDKGFVHRDLKPANVIVGGSPPRARIIDLGLAIDVSERDDLTSTGSTFVGTALYAAPEMLLGRAVGPPADVYALGVMLYEAVVGAAPWPEQESALDYVKAKFQGIAEEAWRRLEQVTQPPGLTPLLRRMLDGEPANRPRAAEVAQALRGMLAAMRGLSPLAHTMIAPGAALAPSASPARETTGSFAAVPAAPASPPERGRPSLALAFLVGALGLGIVVTTFVLLAHHHPPQYPVPIPNPPITNLTDGGGRFPELARWAVMLSGWALLLALGVTLLALAGRRRLAPAGLADPHMLARIEALEAHLGERDALTQSVAIAIDDLGQKLDPAELARVIRESVILAVRELAPATQPPTSDMARALDTIRAIEESKRKPTPGAWERWGTRIKVVGGALAVVISGLGIAKTLGLLHVDRPPEIVSIGPPNLRALRNGTLLVPVEAKDPDGRPLSYAFRASAGTVVASGSAALWTPPTDGAVRLLVLAVEVSDGRHTVEQARTIPVNSPPAGRLVAATDGAGDGVVRVSVEASDADGDPLSYEWRTSSGTLDRDRGPFVFWRPGAERRAEIDCAVSDGFETVTLTTTVRSQRH